MSRKPAIPAALAAALFAALTASGCHLWQGDRHEVVGVVEGSLPAAAARKLVVENSVGAISVEASDGGEVQVLARVLYAGGKERLGREVKRESELVLEANGDTLRVANAHMRSSDRNDWQMDLTVKAPRSLDLDVTSGVGTCSASGFRAQTSIDVGVGTVELRTDECESAVLESGTGDVILTCERRGPTAKARLKSGTGGISIVLPRSFDGEVSLETGTGSIGVSGAPGIAVHRDVVSQSASGRLGGGPARLKAETGTGSISFALK